MSGERAIVGTRRGRPLPSYAEIVANFKARPLCPDETDEDQWQRAGGREAAEAFATWTPLPVKVPFATSDDVDGEAA